MHEVQTESFKRELIRIKWRDKLMSTPGGIDWLIHVGRLYGYNERLLGPDHIGLPSKLYRLMHKSGR